MRTDNPRSAQGRRGYRPHWRRHWVHGACFVLGLGVAWSLRLGATHFGRATLWAKPESSSHPVRRDSSWGELEYTTLNLERPVESLPAPPTEFPPLSWVFENRTRDEVTRLFDTCGLAPVHREALRAASCWQALSNGWTVLPPLEVVRDMNPSARRSIYSVLAQSVSNLSQRCPFRVAATHFDRWLAGTGLPLEKQGLIRRLALVDGDTVTVCDGPLLTRLCTPEEERCLAKALSYVPALLMQLRVGPDSDVAALAAYWGRAGRGRTMRPFLESLTRAPGETSVSVSFFFPAFARLRLYTYPDPVSDRLALREDCYWTALNFFNETPDDRFLDERIVQRTLKTDYFEIKTNWAFGDLILLLENGQTAFHLCVHVADGVVFTKNGVETGAPWVLMRIPDMLSLYGWKQRIELVGLRRRGN